MSEARLFSNARNDIAAALSVATISIPSGIGVGLIAFAPLGSDYAYLGALGGLYGMIFLTLIPVLTGASAYQFNGPGPVEAGILAGLVSTVVTRGLSPEAAITVMFLCAMTAGVFSLLLGQLRLGTLVKLIPYPVIAGILNGVAVLILMSQLPKFAGMPAGKGLTDLVMGRSNVSATAIAVGVATLAAIYASRKYLKKIPDLLAGLVAGTLAYHGLALIVGRGSMGPTMGAVPTTLPLPTQLQPMLELLRSPELQGLLPEIVATAGTIAVISAISCLISATTADIVSNRRHSSVGELTGLGIANLVNALFAGLPGGGTPARVLTNHGAGGRTRLSQLVCALILLAFVSGLGPLIGAIPLAAVAGILVALAFMLVDPWTRLMIRRLFTTKDSSTRVNVLANLGVVLIVFLLVIFVDLVLAIGVGMLLQLLLFLFLAGRTFIRRCYFGDVVHSRTVRHPDAMQALSEAGQAIEVIELQANLFFGTADELTKLVDSIPKETRFVVLDFKRITEIDSTGVLIMKRIDGRLSSEGRTLLLSYLPRGSEKRKVLTEMGLTAPEEQSRVFSDTNSALAWAEEHVLSARDETLVGDDEIPLALTGPCKDLSTEEVAGLEAMLDRRSFASGDRLMSAGEEADGLFILTRGRVEILRELEGGSGGAICLVSFGPGTTVGEMAVLSHEKRSADVVAAREGAAWFLSLEHFRRLQREFPDVAMKLIRNIGASLARRLAANSTTILQLED